MQVQQCEAVFSEGEAELRTVSCCFGLALSSLVRAQSSAVRFSPGLVKSCVAKVKLRDVVSCEVMAWYCKAMQGCCIVL